MRFQTISILLIVTLVSASLASISLPSGASPIYQQDTFETRIEKRHGPGGDDGDESTTSSDYSTAIYTVLEANGTPLTTVSSSDSSISITPDDQEVEATIASDPEPGSSPNSDLEPTPTPDSTSTPDGKTPEPAPESAPSTHPGSQASEPTPISDPAPAPESSTSPTNSDSQEYKPITTSEPSPVLEETPAATSEQSPAPKQEPEQEMEEIHYI